MPFSLDTNGKLKIAGRDENNATKHQGKLASFEAALNTSAAAWFIVLERLEKKMFFWERVKLTI